MELLVNRGQVVILENNHELPTVLAAQPKGGAPGEEAIHGQKDRKPGEASLEPLGQPIEGLQFTILEGRLFSRVLDKLTEHREDQTVGGDKLGLQDRVEIKRLAIAGAGEAVGAMASTETDRPRPIDDHHEIKAQ